MGFTVSDLLACICRYLHTYISDPYIILVLPAYEVRDLGFRREAFNPQPASPQPSLNSPEICKLDG